MSQVTEARLACPLCGNYLEQGNGSGLSEHLQKDCTALKRDGERVVITFAAHCAPVVIDLAPGGGGYGFYGLAGVSDDGDCQYIYLGSPGP